MLNHNCEKKNHHHVNINIKEMYLPFYFKTFRIIFTVKKDAKLFRQGNVLKSKKTLDAAALHHV